jgi:hypothetical protein
MNMTFAIFTDGSVDQRVNQIIDSIEALSIPSYEVLVVGGISSGIDRSCSRHIPIREEGGQRWWITGKKNIATREASFPLVVYLHDYHVFDTQWYTNLCEFGDDFDVCMHRILTIRGHRMFDWLTFDHPQAPVHSYVPYERTDCVKWQYISGGYWVAKRDFMIANPLNENLRWGDAEDVEWSKRIRDWSRIRMNPHCVVRHNKVHRECERASAFEATGWRWS